MRNRLYIDNGRVNCPRRGDIDIDLCFGCSEMVGFEGKDTSSVLVCTGGRAYLDTVHFWTS